MLDICTPPSKKIVYFLGAGASADAGYPLASNLLNKIEEFSKTTLLSATETNIQEFLKFLANTDEPLLKAVLQSPNPELIFTILDLLEATLSEYDMNTWRQLQEEIAKEDEDEIKKINERWENPIRDQLQKFSTARNRFQTALHYYFGTNHYADNESNKRDDGCYLREAFKDLNDGDVIVTTNWDTLAERSLLELKKWCPADGYGFKVELESKELGGRRTESKSHRCPDSKVKVLKLHGSLGWYRNEENSPIYLHSPYLLQHLPKHEDLRDTKSPQSGSGPPMNPVFVMPSYLKQMEGNEMQSIWQQASTALQNADEIIFIGYSLPNADAAIRVLLNPIRQRLKQGGTKVTVIDKDIVAINRYKSFLGNSINHIKKTAKQAFPC